MKIIFLSLFYVLSLCIGTSGECDQTHFWCSDGACIPKYEWCDGKSDCGYDEAYCPNKYNLYLRDCRSDHRRCSDSSMCIPTTGWCDGYASCRDRSDEAHCPCEEFSDKLGEIFYESFVRSGSFIKKCWKVVVGNNQYVELDANIQLANHVCTNANVTIGPANVTSTSNTIVICSKIRGNLTYQNLKTRFYEDVEIVYGDKNSSVYGRDSVRIKYEKIDKTCLLEDKFRCDRYSCVSSEKECDETIDCENGLDEVNCDYGVLSASYSESYRKKARQWMMNLSWKEDTHKAIVAIHLAHDANTNFSIKEQELIVKQLELNVATYLLRNKTDKITVTELSAYINALLVVCHDPKNFYGFDLIAILKEELQKFEGYTPPLPYLTLCNTKELVPEEDVDSLFQILESKSNRGYILEIKALAVLSLACITNNDQYRDMKENVTAALGILKEGQLEDGSFGNDYTTALIAQAMIANSKPNGRDDVLKSAIEYLRGRQRDDGSFGDFLTTYLVLPTLNFKSLVDVGKANCTERLNRSKESVIADINKRLEDKISLKYSLIIGDEKDMILPISLRTPQNITILEFMTLTAKIDPKYEFKTHQIRKKTYIYEISNLPNDPENNKFWFMYEKVGNDTKLIPVQSPDEVTVNEKLHIVMWYKTLDSI